jgi:hypothetical protein
VRRRAKSTPPRNPRGGFDFSQTAFQRLPNLLTVTKLGHKWCAILALMVAPAAVGCAASSVAPIGDHANPGFARSERDLVRDRSQKPDTIARIAVDADGHLYPDPSTRPVDASELRACGFCVRKCLEASGGYDADAVAREHAERLNAMCRGGRTLIVLIHGFNHTYPEASRAYKGTRLEIRDRYPNRNFAYLEVYWDGYYGDPFAIWPQAQVSSKWAGLGLRRILGGLDASIPVRVLTHSRGAAVICAALWNTPMRGTVDEDRRYRAAQDACPPPSMPAIRVGMLAPALRTADFECYEDRGTAPVGRHDRIILGINPDDAALKAGGLSWLAGTALGCSPEQFDAEVAPLLNRGRACAVRVDFSGSAFHAFEDYVLRDVFEDLFLPLLLEDERIPDVSAATR